MAEPAETIFQSHYAGWVSPQSGNCLSNHRRHSACQNPPADVGGNVRGVAQASGPKRKPNQGMYCTKVSWNRFLGAGGRQEKWHYSVQPCAPCPQEICGERETAYSAEVRNAATVENHYGRTDSVQSLLHNGDCHRAAARWAVRPALEGHYRAFWVHNPPLPQLCGRAGNCRKWH